ncbi:MAG: DUF2334 domain-containing protein [Planctomycetota bacterium]
MRALVIRLDDVVDLTPRLEGVWSVLERHRVPVHLGVIPNDLGADAALRLRQRAAVSRSRASVQQHGYRHVNHGVGKKKFEFGDERPAADQRADLAAGKAILEQHLGDLFDGVFVPPWDRCGERGMQALAELGYSGISVIETSTAPRDPRVPHVPMTTDPVQWKPETRHKPWAETLAEVRGRLDREGYAGIELHHEIMDDDALLGLDETLAALGVFDRPTMLEVARRNRGGE